MEEYIDKTNTIKELRHYTHNTLNKIDELYRFSDGVTDFFYDIMDSVIEIIQSMPNINCIDGNLKPAIKIIETVKNGDLPEIPQPQNISKDDTFGLSSIK